MIAFKDAEQQNQTQIGPNPRLSIYILMFSLYSEYAIGFDIIGLNSLN